MKSNDFQIINENWQKFINHKTDEQLLEWFYETYEKNMLLEQSGMPSDQEIQKLLADIEAAEKSGDNSFKRIANMAKAPFEKAGEVIGNVANPVLRKFAKYPKTAGLALMVVVWAFSPEILDGMLTGLDELVRWWALEGKSEYIYINEKYFKQYSYYWDKIFGFSGLNWKYILGVPVAIKTALNMLNKIDANARLQDTQRDIEALIDKAAQRFPDNREAQNRLANGKDVLMQQVREINKTAQQIEDIMKDIGGTTGEAGITFKIKRLLDLVKYIPLLKRLMGGGEEGKKSLNNYRTVYNIVKPELRANLLKIILTLPEDKLSQYLDRAGSYDMKTMALKSVTTTAPEASPTTSQPIGSRVTQALRKRET